MQAEPKKVYVTQPHSPQKRKDGRLWTIGGLPLGMMKDEAEAVVDAINEICWLMERCHACGHRLRFAASACPQCQADAIAPWFEPARLPDKCECDRCVKDRQLAVAGRDCR